MKKYSHNNYNHLYNLKNKNVLITGGGGLLGEQHALALSQIGAKVFLGDINFENAEINSKKINKYLKSTMVFPVNLDVTNEDSISETILFIKKISGNINILVNNASINPKMKKTTTNNIENFPLEVWNAYLNVGLTGAFLCSRLIGHQMSLKKGGVILNIASDLSVISPDHRIYGFNSDGDRIVKPVAYSVVKAGLIGLTKYLATYWADKGVRSNSLSPGGIFDDQDKQFVKNISKLIPLQRMAEPSEYIGALQFLCSDASNYLNGQNIVMDGGRSVW